MDATLVTGWDGHSVVSGSRTPVPKDGPQLSPAIPLTPLQDPKVGHHLLT